MRSRAACFAAVLIAMSANAQAQWVNYVPAGTPKTNDGKPDLNATTPRTPDRKPDLTGVWQVESAPIPDLIRLLPGGENGLGEDIPSKYFISVLADFAPGEEPLQPAAKAAASKLSINTLDKDAPNIACLPAGLPLVVTAPAPFKIVQTPVVTLMLSEADTTFRQVFTDGRALPSDPQPSFMGSSVGRWEGDTLVVQSVGFNDRVALDAMGHMHSTALTITERYHRRDYGHLDIEMTFVDPNTFTKPVTVRFAARLRPDTDLIEYFCTENEKDRDHLAAQKH